MSGAEILAQVEEALGPKADGWERAAAIRNLDGCVLLTAEEANWLVANFGWAHMPETRSRCRALLTPDPKEQP